MGYFFAQLKRCLRLGPMLILSAVCLGGLSGALLFAKLQDYAGQQQKLTVAVAGETSDDYFQMGLKIFSETDNSRNTVQFVEMDEDEAIRALERQQVSAVLVIPKDFIASVMRGENDKATLITGTSQANLGMKLVSEIADTVSVLLTESQTGIYTFSEFSLENVDQTYTNDEIMQLNLRYFDLILPRDELYAVDTPDSAPSVSLAGYYVCAVCIVFFLFMGMAGAPLFIQEDRSLSRVMAARGRGALYQCLSEYGAWCVFLLLVYTILFVAAAVIFSTAGCPVPELNGIALARIAGLWAGLAPVAIVAGALEYMLCRLSKRLVPGVLLCFGCAAVLGYLTGCFYPLSFMPEQIQSVVSVLPTGLLLTYMERFLLGEPVLGLLFGLAVWTALLLAAAWLAGKRAFAR